MRDQANMTGDAPKWIILDGDIDPMWIESLNTLMDDNKILTLASNERISLTPSMRLLFEISHLRTATPATVSRAGIIYLNTGDLGWNPYVTSWIDKREIQSEKANLMVLFDKYIPTCMDILRMRFKKITPTPEISHLMMLCQLLDCLLTPENTPADSPKEVYETYFVFAAMWAFGSALYQDGNIDYRVEFSKWFIQEFKTVKFPSTGTVFDYFIERETLRFASWTEKIPKFELDPDTPLQSQQDSHIQRKEKNLPIYLYIIAIVHQDVAGSQPKNMTLWEKNTKERIPSPFTGPKLVDFYHAQRNTKGVSLVLSSGERR
ncbi:hypothetical protein SK128_011276 [Halocaridina rubra]|uniref:Dynein heavy chain AAA 5 extension domain-containing protein n=1 Tax=Halocaridina rubra TaxID=373956 RepID=A0AAN8WNA8_HALRR